MELQFDFSFEEPNDELFCCYTVPYTYTEMTIHLHEIKALTAKKHFDFLKIESIGQSLGGIDIPIVKISSGSDKKKPVVVIIGRQHSGETHSSFIIHGLINTLVSQNPVANKMRNLFEWWVLPMVNPDGIIAGNYRTNCQGKDMNRHFFEDGDPLAEKEGRCSEVETIRDYMKSNLTKG